MKVTTRRVAACAALAMGLGTQVALADTQSAPPATAGTAATPTESEPATGMPAVPMPPHGMDYSGWKGCPYARMWHGHGMQGGPMWGHGEGYGMPMGPPGMMGYGPMGYGPMGPRMMGRMPEGGPGSYGGPMRGEMHYRMRQEIQAKVAHRYKMLMERLDAIEAQLQRIEAELSARQ